MSYSRPLITIITATFNADKYLENSIRSVLSQTYTNYEYLIIDGKSTDKTPKIIEKYNAHITFWISEPDTGIYDAWNKGIKQSKGDFIVFIGADDQLLPSALEDYVTFLESNPSREFDYISSRIKRVKLDGTLEGIVGKSWNWDEFKYRMTTAHPGSLHSKLLFETYGNYSTAYQIVSDYEMLLRAGKDLKAGYLEKITAIMSTGGKFLDVDSTKECIKMFEDKGHLSSRQYLFISTYLKLRSWYLKYFTQKTN